MGLIDHIIIDQEKPKNRMHIHLFKAVLSEYMTGKIDGNQAKNALETQLGQTLDAEAVTHIQTLIGLIDAETGAEAKSRKLGEIYRVLYLAEEGIIYTTAAEVKTRLGL